MVVSVVLVFAVALAAAAVTRRAMVIAVAAAFWPIYFAGLSADLWGSGVGDNWQHAAAALTAAGTLGALVGLALGRGRGRTTA